MASFFNFGRFGGKQPGKDSAIHDIDIRPPPNPDGSLTSLALSPDKDIAAPSRQRKSTQSQQSSHHPKMAGDLSRSSGSSRRLPFYFREENSSLIVKGNFMTLAAKPTHVEKGEWLAHQIVEQYRLLEGMLKIVQEIDQRTGVSLCNVQTCPQMMAANNTIYTWLDNQKNPIRIPASQYITLVQKWIMGKINDPRNFPTETSTVSVAPLGGTAATLNSATSTGVTHGGSATSESSKDRWIGRSSGFPQNFEHDMKNLYRQMFRCYAHIYYAHWLDPFYHLGLYKELNTCFIHFINVGRQFDLLMEKDLVPMQPLIDIWLAKELLPHSKQMDAAVDRASN